MDSYLRGTARPDSRGWIRYTCSYTWAAGVRTTFLGAAAPIDSSGCGSCPARDCSSFNLAKCTDVAEALDDSRSRRLRYVPNL